MTFNKNTRWQNEEGVQIKELNSVPSKPVTTNSSQVIEKKRKLITTLQMNDAELKGKLPHQLKKVKQPFPKQVTQLL